MKAVKLFTCFHFQLKYNYIVFFSFPWFPSMHLETVVFFFNFSCWSATSIYKNNLLNQFIVAWCIWFLTLCFHCCFFKIFYVFTSHPKLHLCLLLSVHPLCPIPTHSSSSVALQIQAGLPRISASPGISRCKETMHLLFY